MFSAGLYDVIKEILQQAGLKKPNVHIVSNRMIFDKDDYDTGVCVGFHDPLIHVFNKNEARMHGAPYEEQVAGRKHIASLYICFTPFFLIYPF